MLHIHFTEADLARTRVATGPDPLWETVMGLHQLAGPGRGKPVFAAWRERARRALHTRELAEAARLLATVAPGASYFPDFLTPGESEAGLDPGLDAVRDTPPERLRREVARTAAATRRTRWASGWQRSLAAGDRERLDDIAGMLAAVHEAVIAPGWSRVAATVDGDRALRARELRDGGTDALLASLAPAARWEPPVLHVRYPAERHLRLNGRGLRLVPSGFCWGAPTGLADPGLPPVLVYPAVRDEAAAADAFGAARRSHPAGLCRLLGRTRARVLAVLDRAATTGEIAGRLDLAPATVSEHVRVLREADLAASLRDGGTVLHTLTPLGEALLRGEL